MVSERAGHASCSGTPSLETLPLIFANVSPNSVLKIILYHGEHVVQIADKTKGFFSSKAFVLVASL